MFLSISRGLATHKSGNGVGAEEVRAAVAYLEFITPAGPSSWLEWPYRRHARHYGLKGEGFSMEPILRATNRRLEEVRPGIRPYYSTSYGLRARGARKSRGMIERTASQRESDMPIAIGGMQLAEI